MGNIPMDQVGYKRLLLEIDEAKEKLQKIQQSRAEQIRSQRSDDSLIDASMFMILERQASQRLEELLEQKRNAKIVDSKHPSSTIGYGSIVKVIFLEDSDSAMELKVVSNSPREGEVSVQSPIGKALYGRKVGDVIEYTVGDCFFQARVEEID